MDGYSEQWVPSGRSLQKMYARLPYGNYIFQAEIYNTDRVLASVELPFEILSPWYLSYWAVGSYILAGLCLLAFSVHFSFFTFFSDFVIFQVVKWMFPQSLLEDG